MGRLLLSRRFGCKRLGISLCIALIQGALIVKTRLWGIFCLNIVQKDSGVYFVQFFIMREPLRTVLVNPLGRIGGLKVRDLGLATLQSLPKPQNAGPYKPLEPYTPKPYRP